MKTVPEMLDARAQERRSRAFRRLCWRLGTAAFLLSYLILMAVAAFLLITVGADGAPDPTPVLKW